MNQAFPDCCSNCEYRTTDCEHELRNDLAVYFSRNPDAPCPCR